MAQDGTSQIDPQREKELRGKVEEKLGKLEEHRDARRLDAIRQAEAREAKLQRQYALEQAAGIVKSTMDWQDDGSTNSREAGRAALELADRFYRWVETGQLPAA